VAFQRRCSSGTRIRKWHRASIPIRYAHHCRAALAFITNWLALIPWRRAKKQHWSERARLYFLVRVAAAFCFLTVPSLWTLIRGLDFWVCRLTEGWAWSMYPGKLEGIIENGFPSKSRSIHGPDAGVPVCDQVDSAA